MALPLRAKEIWLREQAALRPRIVTHDNTPWAPCLDGPVQETSQCCKQASQEHATISQTTQQHATPHQPLRLVGGLDISFFPALEPRQQVTEGLQSKRLTASLEPQQQAGGTVPARGEASAFEDQPQQLQQQQQQQQQQQEAGGVAALVVVTFPDLEPVYQDFEHIAQFPCPYMPGFLAFREVPFYSALLDRAALAGGGVHFPQVVLVDGCGLLHPQRCGSASHLGVVRNIPTIGVSKNVFAIGGLDRCAIESAFEAVQQQPHNHSCLAATPLASSVSNSFRAAGSSVQQQPLDQGCPATMPMPSSSSSQFEVADTPAQQPPPPPHDLLQSQHHHDSHDLQHHRPRQHKMQLNLQEARSTVSSAGKRQEMGTAVSRVRVREALVCSQGPSLKVEALPSRHRLCSLTDASSELLGAALCGPSTKKPIYVSIGHRVSLETAVAVVLRCCRHRFPEPLRLADLQSRAIVDSLSRVA